MRGRVFAVTWGATGLGVGYLGAVRFPPRLHASKRRATVQPDSPWCNTSGMTNGKGSASPGVFESLTCRSRMRTMYSVASKLAWRGRALGSHSRYTPRRPLPAIAKPRRESLPAVPRATEPPIGFGLDRATQLGSRSRLRQ